MGDLNSLDWIRGRSWCPRPGMWFGGSFGGVVDREGFACSTNEIWTQLQRRRPGRNLTRGVMGAEVPLRTATSVTATEVGLRGRAGGRQPRTVQVMRTGAHREAVTLSTHLLGRTASRTTTCSARGMFQARHCHTWNPSFLWASTGLGAHTLNTAPKSPAPLKRSFILCFF